MALAPCLLGYGQIAARLFADARTVREGNPYWKWIANYVAGDYVDAVVAGRGWWFPGLSCYPPLDGGGGGGVCGWAG